MRHNGAGIKTLTFVMFLMFAMTTDSVGIIIPEIIKTYRLSMTAAGTFQYATMSGIALAGFFLGHLADTLGRKQTVIVGLILFAASSYLFAAGNTFVYFSILLASSGMGIGIFKTGALALIGDLSKSTREHTSLMNTVEGFFGVGSIIGPAILARLLATGASWKGLYILAGTVGAVLVLIGLKARFPPTKTASQESMDFSHTVSAMKNRYTLAFSLGAFLYVATEAAIYVWMPTLLAGYRGSAVAVAAYSVSIFFVLRAAGRFIGAWMLGRFYWTKVLALFSAVILACFAGSAIGGAGAAVYLLPASGLFMSVIYPSINSKGISCFPKSEHGAVAGVILFFTCVSAVVGPLAMGAISDAMGHPKYGFLLATCFAALLFAGLLLNWIFDPTRAVLSRLDEAEYQRPLPAEA
ncbi:MAG TPA: MFS transporter [Bryobacteraceae bacterium]|nr:MFS transporter [Bryobacteraceae bacterium]